MEARHVSLEINRKLWEGKTLVSDDWNALFNFEVIEEFLHVEHIPASQRSSTDSGGKLIRP